MELIDQHTKRIMEGCKERARDAGLRFQSETLEYIVTNKDLLELGPKNMIPTLYDYWVHEVEVLKEKGRYELFPHNPYETVINTRPAISFYNDNNPDWLNVMIFYHVLGHIDFFQNNHFFSHTWDKDFAGEALSDKRLIAMLRAEKGRWVDYVIEFARGIDNLVGYYSELSERTRPGKINSSERLDFYFDHFLQGIKQVKLSDYLKEVDRYNQSLKRFGDMGESVFFSEVTKKYPEFENLFNKHKKQKKEPARDLIQYLQQNSPFLQKQENIWMKTVMEIVRKTSIYFQPQIRTKILNEGWASYWHEKLFLEDDRIRGHEVDFARVNAKVTSLPRVGINPYAIGMRLFNYIEEWAERGRFSYEFEKIKDVYQRNKYDKETGEGMKYVFRVREDFDDFMFINTFLTQDFVDQHKLFVAGRRANTRKGVWEYYVKSRKAEDYRDMVLDSLYHPPYIEIDEQKGNENLLYLNHHFEGKPLVKEFIHNTMLGIEFLWGGTVKLETTELVPEKKVDKPYALFYAPYSVQKEESDEKKYKETRVLYTMEKRKLTRTVL
ncbi:MAG: SpoVR family protein [Deltaproteobacteria bacterium]|nr:SpoVR family protein [Deltaproteobacteria bacterium]MBW2129444.1 SpoVR family protein [Deltaproteobacteria bacterium]MBW2304662.1 SpoVR family protein [Deltaproteobacteria bacterium]